MNRLGILQVLSFFAYLLVQVILLKNLALFGTAFCFAYVAYFLFFPVETNPLALMGIAFLMGISLDIFYNSPGLHAAASVLMTYARSHWLNTITPQGGYDVSSVPSLRMGGLQWFLVYSIPLIFLHHLTLFFVEVGGSGLFWFTLGKASASTAFTSVVIVLMQYLFARRKR